MIKERYHVRIVPHRGDAVHRFTVTGKLVATALGVLGVVVLGSLLFALVQVARANAQANALAHQRQSEQRRLQSIDQQTDALRKQLQRVQRQNNEIRQLIGVGPPKGHGTAKRMSLSRPARRDMSALETKVQLLAAVSAQTQLEADQLRQLAMHVLNVRHLRDIELAREIAYIPSIDPVAGAPVTGCYCYRTYPDVEFHKGVDIEAGYGEIVRATAAGTVAFAGWDGGYGIKIDLDHGNGYHTWYAHLSHLDIVQGQRVYKGQAIGLVGATGFSTGPHLHYQVMRNGSAVDPTPYLDGVPKSALASLP